MFAALWAAEIADVTFVKHKCELAVGCGTPGDVWLLFQEVLKLKLLKLVVLCFFKQVLDVQLVNQLVAPGLRTSNRKLAFIDVGLDMIGEAFRVEDMLTHLKWYHLIFGKYFEADLAYEILHVLFRVGVSDCIRHHELFRLHLLYEAN